MARKGSTAGPISIKGTRGEDRIVIGEPGYVYSAADQQRGFVINSGNADDFIAGGLGVDQVLAGSGYDDIIAQEEDLLGASQRGTVAYDGGVDLDILRFQNWTDGFGIDLGNTNTAGDRDSFMVDANLVMTGPSAELSGSWIRGITTSIEGVIGGYGDDYIAGDWGGNYLEGGPGDDYINGERGRDQIVGGEGDDFLFVYDEDMVSGDYTDTVPETFTPGERGNDVFSVGGGTVGQYFINTITDFDTRTGAEDTQYDQLWINSNFVGRLVFDEATQAVIYIWGDQANGDLGQATLAGLTEADMQYVPIVIWDAATGMPVI